VLPPNEWTGRHRPDNGGYSPLERLHAVRENFPKTRQNSRPALRRLRRPGPRSDASGGGLRGVQLSPKTRNRDTCVSRVSTRGRNGATAARWPGLRNRARISRLYAIWGLSSRHTRDTLVAVRDPGGAR